MRKKDFRGELDTLLGDDKTAPRLVLIKKSNLDSFLQLC